MPNIALVVLDTLRKDAFEEHFGWLPGRRFENAWSTSHWTVPAHASLFTGQYASEVGVYSGSQHLNCDVSVLAEKMRSAGYRTRGYSTNINISSIFSFDRGFDDFDNFGHHSEQMRHLTDPDIFNWTDHINQDNSRLEISSYATAILECLRDDCATVPSLQHGMELKFDTSNWFGSGESGSDMGGKKVLKEVRNLDFKDDEFLFLNLMEAHGPYLHPEEYETVSEYETPSNPVGKIENTHDIDTLRARYDDAAKYLSDIYQKLFDELAPGFDYIITLSDHGELLGEHGFCGHAAGLYPELTNIPLTIYTGEDSVIRDRTNVSLLDVHKTILSVANTNMNSGRGQNLLSTGLDDSEYLTEYHGIPHPDRTLEPLREWVEDENIIQQYQKWRKGISLSNYYRYETLDGIKEQGESPVKKPDELLSELVEDLDIAEQKVDESDELPDEVQEELEHLGYL